MFKPEEVKKEVAENKISINGTEYMVTDDIAESIYNLIHGIKTTSNKGYGVKKLSTKVIWEVVGNVPKLGYVVTFKDRVESEIFKSVCSDVRKKHVAYYVKGLGFVFDDKATADKYMKDYK